MRVNLKRINAIFIKELQDVRKNTNVIYMFFLPVILTILWDKFIPDMPAGFALGFGLLFLVVMVGMYVPSMIIAEEKEKKTMGVLMLSPATPLEVFIGKGLLTFVSIIVITIILILVTGSQVVHLPVILVSTILASICSILIGMIVGLLAANQMATGVIGTPIYLLLLIFPLYGGMGVEFMRVISKFLPTYYYFEMLRRALEEGQNLINMPKLLLILLFFILIFFIVLHNVYRKKGLE